MSNNYTSNMWNIPKAMPQGLKCMYQERREAANQISKNLLQNFIKITENLKK